MQILPSAPNLSIFKQVISNQIIVKHICNRWRKLVDALDFPCSTFICPSQDEELGLSGSSDESRAGANPVLLHQK
ncbi:MAG: hypothetical protein ACFB02_22160 [Mastigocoleus sp.]